MFTLARSSLTLARFNWILARCVWIHGQVQLDFGYVSLDLGQVQLERVVENVLENALGILLELPCPTGDWHAGRRS